MTPNQNNSYLFDATPINLELSNPGIELEERILGAILLDPAIVAVAAKLPAAAFSVSTHRQIFQVMQKLHQQGLKPDLPTMSLRLTEQKLLKHIGGQSKLVQLLDRTVHSGSVKQYVGLLQERYNRAVLSDRLSHLAEAASTTPNVAAAISQTQSELEALRNVTSDNPSNGDISNLDQARVTATVASVTAILTKALPEWSEQAHLDTLQQESGISKQAFWELVKSQRCASEEVLPEDKQQLDRLIEWKNAKLDFHKVLPHLAANLLHDGEVLNIDPVMLWQYLLPTTLSLIGKETNLEVGSHQVPSVAWTCIVGESGTGKSRAESVILAPLKAWQSAEYNRFDQEWTEYKQTQAKKDSEPVEPPTPERKYLFVIATIQALIRRLSEQGNNGSLWARDEIAGLFKSLNQFTAKGEGEGLECLLQLWDNTTAPIDRVQHEDSFHLSSGGLSIAGGIQPGVFRKIFTDPEDAQGIQARFLYALCKPKPAKVTEGYCYLSDKLPELYRWIDRQFPHGTIKFSSTAKARYKTVYEEIGQQAELASTPAVRAWMRKLPGQLLRIALALHVIECYHEPQRPRQELQLDTLNRAVEFCRYYRSTFEVVQHSATDSDVTSSVLLRIWDMAATSPNGLAVRDAYRSIKALSRRAKELGRSVAAYTTDLYYQLEKLGRGTVERCGRVVRFVIGTNNSTAPPPESVTVVPDDETVVPQALEVSTPEQVSTVTVTAKSVEVNPERGLIELEQAVVRNSESISQAELQPWLARVANCQTAADCRDCLEALNQLSPVVVEQIWHSAEKLLPHFWEVAALELRTTDQPEIPIGNTETDDCCSAAKTASRLGQLVVGIWVRTTDGFYGYLRSMLSDGRWWVAPETDSRDTSARIYAAADIIPLPVS